MLPGMTMMRTFIAWVIAQNINNPPQSYFRSLYCRYQEDYNRNSWYAAEWCKMQCSRNTQWTIHIINHSESVWCIYRSGSMQAWRSAKPTILSTTQPDICICPNYMQNNLHATQPSLMHHGPLLKRAYGTCALDVGGGLLVLTQGMERQIPPLLRWSYYSKP